jgi:hypothetical protein
MNLARIDLFLDAELTGGELEAFNRHVRECSSCREELIERRRFLERIRAARPSYSVSAELRREVAAILWEPAGSGTVPAPGRAVRRIAGRNRVWFAWLSRRPIAALVAFFLAIAGVALLARLSLTEARANAFVDMAAQTHRQQLAGQLPLEVRTRSSSEITAWFADKVPFQFRLPTYEEVDGQAQKYELTGGTLVDFKGARAAYISYRMGAQTISLLLTSASSSVAAGGEKTVSKSLTFHAHRRGDLQVVTWSVHNLTYALVSAVTLPVSQSCVVCHAGADDRKLIQNLKSRTRPQTGRSLADASGPAGHLRGGMPVIIDIRKTSAGR